MSARTRHAAALLACCGVALVLAAGALGAGAGRLQQQISAGQNRVQDLAGAVGAASGRLAHLSASIGGLQSQIRHVQGDLDNKRGELLRLRTGLTTVRARLAQLEALQARAEAALSQQVINSYESDSPDIVSVVLEAHGFQDLLERLSFAQRIRNQDAHVVAGVRAARRAVAAQATRLGSLESRQQTLTVQVLAQRNQLDSSRLDLVKQQIAVAQVRRAKANQLAGARAKLADLQRQLSQVKAQQEATSSSGGTSFGGSGGPAGSAGGFTFPLPKGAASPPGTWSQDQGVDIAAPGGTSEFAVCSGTIVLHGIGGFGPWAPVLHCDSSLGSGYVYYGHAGPGNQLPVGTHVSAGQTISEVGPGIVGISSGPHLEIGFSDSSGSPAGGTSGQMLSLLQRSY